MKLSFFTILSIIGFMTFGQTKGQYSISPGELDKIYVQALDNNFALLLSSGWKYIEMNEFGKRIAKLDVADRYKFLSNTELIDLSIKKKKSIPIFRLTHKIYGVDTVDINFSVLTMTSKRKIHFNKGLRFKTALFSLQCRGIGDYEPDMRFIRNATTNEWELKEVRNVQNP